MQCTLTALLEFWVCSHDPISIQFTIGDDKHQKNVGHKRTDFNLRNLCHYTIDNKNTCYFETNASLGDFIFIFFLSFTFQSSKFKYISSSQFCWTRMTAQMIEYYQLNCHNYPSKFYCIFYLVWVPIGEKGGRCQMSPKTDRFFVEMFHNCGFKEWIFFWKIWNCELY